ncbi:MAG: APC family permease [Bacteroidota bacterium]
MVDSPSDHKELQKFGYPQQLARRMGGFSSFAISFSLISIITGIFANFQFGIQQVGGAIIWSWTLVGLGQLLVAVVMADLAGRFPISGYGYQWTSRLSNPHVGYFVGWLLLMQFITGFPGVCQALGATLVNMMGGGGDWTVTWLTVGIIVLITIVHLFGIRLVSWVNDAGVFAEILGVIILILILWGTWVLAGEWQWDNLLNSTNASTGEAAGFSAFALSLLVGAWCMTGFEAAADLAEETKDPRKTVPKAVILSQLGAAVGGVLLLGGFILAAESMSALQSSETPLIMVLETKLGNLGSRIFGFVILLSIFACGVASMATVTRLIFSLARDNMLPFSDLLKQVQPVSKTPMIATLVVCVLSCTFILTVRNLALITSISAVAGYLGYCGILYASISSTADPDPIDGVFSLGKWRNLSQWTALGWTVLVVAALTIPPTEVAGMDETHLPAKSAFFAILLGLGLYVLWIRGRIQKGNAGPPSQLEA